MPSPDPKHFHPSWRASELRNSIGTSSSSPSLWNYFTRKILTKGLGEKDKCPEGRNLCTWRIPWMRMRKETWGLWKVRRHEWTKSQCGIFLLSPKGSYLGTSQVTLESTLLTVNISIPPSQELLLQEWGSEINAMGTWSIQCAFLIGVENVSTIYNNGGTINFSLQAEAYQNKEVPNDVLFPNI